MRTFRRVMTFALMVGILAFAVVPFLIPFESSGTQTNVQVAGPDAKFTELGGVSVHYKETDYTGDCNCEAPLIVLMHGFGASTFSWRDVEKPLSVFGNVISYDRPAFGFTERPVSWTAASPYSFEGNFAILDDLIAKFGAGRQVILVGHSAGGQLAAEYARVRGEAVDGLILVDPAILTTGGGPEGFGWFYEIPQIDRLGPLLVSSIATSGDKLIYQSFFDQTKVTAALLEGYHRPLKIAGWERAFWNFATASKANDLKANLGSITRPTLLITGSNDTVVATADTVKLQTLIPGSALEIIPRAGHLPHEERPAEFMTAISAHWKQFAVK